jgi:uncharacterized C2H2 Zn-finger protein
MIFFMLFKFLNIVADNDGDLFLDITRCVYIFVWRGDFFFGARSDWQRCNNKKGYDVNDFFHVI